jgi:hypothetical protein
MNILLCVLVLGFAAALALAEEPASQVVTTGTILEEMSDLSALAQWPKPTYRNGQFSSYDRSSYYYAMPDVIDDHRGLMPGDMEIQMPPSRDMQARGGATGAKCLNFDDIPLEATAGKVENKSPMPLALRLHVAQWKAEKGAKLKFNIPIEKDGKVSVHIIALHRPEGAVVRVSLDGKPLTADGNLKEVRLRSDFATRDLNVNFAPVEAKAGSATVEIECVEPGELGLDSIWIRNEQ